MTAPAALWRTEVEGPAPLRAELRPAEAAVALRFTAPAGSVAVLFERDEVYALREALGAWLAAEAAAACERHNPVHRDRRGAWCLDCGRDAVGAVVVENVAAATRGLS